MPLDYRPMLQYLRGKFKLWKQESERLEKQAPMMVGKKKILEDLEKDADILKASVCPYIKEAGYAQARSTVLQAAEGLVSNDVNFPVVGTVDIVLGALLDTCGYVRRGDSLLEADL